MYYPLAGLQFGKRTDTMTIGQLIPGLNQDKKLTIVRPEDTKKDIPVTMPTIDVNDVFDLPKISNQAGDDADKSIFSFPHILPLGVKPSKLRAIEADRFEGNITIEGLPDALREALFPTTIIVPSPAKNDTDVPNNDSDSKIGRIIHFLA